MSSRHQNDEKIPACKELKVHLHLCGEVRYLVFVLGLPPLRASSEGSGETVWMCKKFEAFEKWDKYQNLVHWPICSPRDRSTTETQ